MRCYVINLARDTERMARISEVLAAFRFLAVTRIGAVRGSELPDLACDLLTGRPEMRRHKGTLGCSLSHAHAWQSVLDSGESCALILEDDSQPRRLDILEGWQPPPGVDLVFCNSRMVYRDAGTDLLPVLPALDFMISNKTAVGGDGYLVSADGARKLLKFFEIDKFHSHVDLRLAAYSLSPDDVATFQPQQGIIRDICTLRRAFRPEHRLSARVLGTSLTAHVKGAPSSRHDEDKLAPARGCINLIAQSQSFEGFATVLDRRHQPLPQIMAAPPAAGAAQRFHSRSDAARSLVVGAWPDVTVVAGQSYTLSAWVWLPRGFDGGRVGLRLSGSQTLKMTPADLSVRDAWQRISVTAWVAAPRCSAELLIWGATDRWIASTCWQLERGSAATAYVGTGG